MDFLPQKGLCLFSQILEQIEYGTSVKHTVSLSPKSDIWQASAQSAKDPMRIINCELSPTPLSFRTSPKNAGPLPAVQRPARPLAFARQHNGRMRFVCQTRYCAGSILVAST